MYEEIAELVEHSKVEHPIFISAKENRKYWKDFLLLTKDFREKLSEKEYREFLSKSKLDKQIDIGQYLQFASEVTVTDYILRNFEEFVNEPTYDTRMNPECSFKYQGRTVNIEVKCPDYTKRRTQENVDVKTFAADRLPNKEVLQDVTKIIDEKLPENETVGIIDRLDNKLKDYLVSAHNKFPTSDKSYFNILVIALDIISDLDEWYTYLFGNEGAFTENSFIEEDYSNVDAILLTNIQHGHMISPLHEDENFNCWHMENYLSLLFLNPLKEENSTLASYYFNNAINIFGPQTADFLQYQCELDKANMNKYYPILESHKIESEQFDRILFDYWINFKITDNEIISEWSKTLQTRNSN